MLIQLPDNARPFLWISWWFWNHQTCMSVLRNLVCCRVSGAVWWNDTTNTAVCTKSSSRFPHYSHIIPWLHCFPPYPRISLPFYDPYPSVNYTDGCNHCCWFMDQQKFDPFLTTACKNKLFYIPSIALNRFFVSSPISWLWWVCSTGTFLHRFASFSIYLEHPPAWSQSTGPHSASCFVLLINSYGIKCALHQK